VSILGRAPYTLTRYSGGSRNADGEWSSGSSATSTIYLTVQPMSGEELQQLPEGLRARRAYKAYGADALRVADVDGVLEADRVTIDGRVCMVLDVDRQRSIIAHYKTLLVAVPEVAGP